MIYVVRAPEANAGWLCRTRSEALRLVRELLDAGVNAWAEEDTMTDQERIVYEQLKAAGHSPIKAGEIILDARRGVNHALQWIKAVTGKAYEDSQTAS